ncbi:serine/threonine-protein kinase [Aliikangiella sp. IMCC44359]|uniref:serine/threonine-protein kinase n=1 Tax=Aliikangiella sp. IMCC44359 TaxID=3459125 RepID=UPI00403AAD8C
MLKIPGYTIHSKLGVGGMAVVYLATQDSLCREVALKVMVDSNDTNVNFKKRFIHEGHDLASLQHPNIVTIYDISHTKQHYYYAMEFLKDGSLSERLKTGVSLVDAFNIILQIGSALECAHQHNIIHRDLKPGNILFRDPATPVLTDFGIAKNIERDTQLTKTGALLGTPSYMSPEQCRGSVVDARSDQYSLCILFFELITGYLPFEATDSIAVAMKQISEPIPSLPDNLAALQPLINIALDKDPEERFTSVGEFCRVLNDLLTGEDSLKGQMNNITQKLSIDELSKGSYQQSYQSLGILSNANSSNVSLPTEDEFWNEGRTFKKWFYIVIILVAAGFGGHYYYVNDYQNSVETEKERFIPVLMRQAERQVALSQLLVPSGNNAYETLMKVLALEPNYQPALQMMEDAATSYEMRALDYIANKEFVKARRQLNRGLKFSAHHKGLEKAMALLDEKQNKARRHQ